MPALDDRSPAPEYGDRSSRRPPRRAVAWILGAGVVSIPVVAVVMWAMRRDFLTGVDCTTLGPYDCAYDGGLAAAYGAFVGTLLMTGGLGGWLIARRWPRLGLVVAATAVCVWLVIAGALIAATRS